MIAGVIKMNEMDKTKMIARANAALESVAVEFTESLNARVHDLEQAIIQNKRDQIVAIAYNLESEASTFGWPRVTRICKWFRMIFSGDYDEKPKAEEVLKVLNALKSMVSDPQSPDEQRDIELFKEIYPYLQRVVSDI